MAAGEEALALGFVRRQVDDRPGHAEGAVDDGPVGLGRDARGGEVGLEEGWTLAKYVEQTLDNTGENRAIVAIVDVPSQAYGRREELLGQVVEVLLPERFRLGRIGARLIFAAGALGFDLAK